MSTVMRSGTQAMRRLSFTFAADGSYAACLAACADGGWYVESWRLPADGPAVPSALRPAGGRAVESLRSQLVALPDGRVLVCRHDGDRHALVLLTPGGDGGPGHPAEELSLATLRLPGLRLLPIPQAAGTAGQTAGQPGGQPGNQPGGSTSAEGGRLVGSGSWGAGETAAVSGAAGRMPAGAEPVLGAGESGDGPSRLTADGFVDRGPGGAYPADGGGVSRAGGPVAVALGTDTRPVTTVWLVPAAAAEPVRVAELPGLYGGGVWLDKVGRLLALDRVADGVVKTVVLDLELGSVTPLLEIAERSNDRLVLFDPETRFGMVRSDAPGADRLGWGLLGGSEPVRFPDCLHIQGMFLRPIALAPGDGTAEPRVAVQLDHGAGSALALWQPSGGRLDPLPVPAGRLGAIGHWSAAGLRMPFSAPDRPAALATLEVETLLGQGPASAPSAVPLPLQLAPLGGGAAGGPGRESPEWASPARAARGVPSGWRLDGSAVPGDGGRWHPAQCLELAGPAGPIESVVYGGDAWLSAPHLVVALHGGPADAWRLEFDPALQRMAAEGLAVLAPNQRGSTGYGPEHAMAIRGAWGGPDLEDVLALVEGVAGQRAALGLEPPALFGVSYGAFLALLAAAHAPAEQVARCAVVAPFLSGARLLAEASAPVRALTGRLGGDQPIEDARGPRDVLQLAHRLQVPLLVVHGDRDEVVPVSQSRSLRHELLRLGRVEGQDFRYVEASGAGHEVLAEEGAAVLHELLAGFLRTGRAG